VDSDLFPLQAESTAPSFALIIEQSRNLQISPIAGPFQPVRLIIHLHGQWRLESPIFSHRKIELGRKIELSSRVRRSRACEFGLQMGAGFASEASKKQ